MFSISEFIEFIFFDHRFKFNSPENKNVTINFETL